MVRCFIALVILWALTAPAAAGEVERLRDHFATVDRELRAADVRGLTGAQRERRTALIAELARYRDRGVFPRNLDFAASTPYFVDDRGVRCAMAHLIETHGGEELVARVAARSNNAYVRELAVDAEIAPALAAWLEHNGLTVAEAARIQPGYVREIGQSCYASGLYYCRQGVTCVPTEDDPMLSFCSPPCGPDGACPVGSAGVQMECQARGDHNVCVYPAPSPGTVGWPCDANTADVCPHACIGLEEPSDVGTCAPPCSNTRVCPTGYECEPLPAGETDELRTCFPTVEDSGCSVAGRPSLLALLALALVARRRRANGARTRRSR